MSKVKIAGSSVVITSELKVTELEKVKKFSKDGLTLKDSNGNDVFTIALSNVSTITPYGITYAGQDSEGYAQATLMLDENIPSAKRKETFIDSYAIELANLNTLENFIREHVTSIENTVATVEDMVEVVD